MNWKRSPEAKPIGRFVGVERTPDAIRGTALITPEALNLVFRSTGRRYALVDRANRRLGRPGGPTIATRTFTFGPSSVYVDSTISLDGSVLDRARARMPQRVLLRQDYGMRKGTHGSVLWGMPSDTELVEGLGRLNVLARAAKLRRATWNAEAVRARAHAHVIDFAKNMVPL